MPAPGGSLGGGADLNLVIDISGFSGIADKCKDIIEEIRKGKESFSTAEVEAAKEIRAQAQKAASEFAESAGVAETSKAAADSQAQAFAQVFGEYKHLVTAIDLLRNTVLKSAKDEEGEEEDEEVADRAAEAKEKVKGEKGVTSAISKFFDVGKQASGAISGILSSVSITTMGVGGIIGFLLYGLKRDEMLRAAGERYSQLWDKTIDTLNAEGFKTARQHASELGKRFANLVDTFRVSKEEANAVMQTLTNAGMTSEEAERFTTIKVGGAVQKVADATAAIDQTFRLTEGSAAKAATQLINQYGMSAEAATDAVGMLAVAGREAGIGVQNFMNDVMTATGQIRQYGAQVQDTIDVAASLKDMLEKKGLAPHLAATTAVMATGQIAAGLAGMSKGMQMVMAERLGMGRDIAGYFALMDARLDPERGFAAFKGMWTESVKLVQEGRHLTREETAVALDGLIPGVSFQSRLIMVDAVGALTNTNASKKARADAETTFNEAFQKERDRTVSFEQTIRDMARDIGQVGLGLFNLIAAGLAEIVVGMQLLPLELKKKFHIITDAEEVTRKRLWNIGKKAYAVNLQALKDITQGVSAMPAHMAGALPATRAMEALIGAATTPTTVVEQAAAMRPFLETEMKSMLAPTVGLIRRIARRRGGTERVVEAEPLAPSETVALREAARRDDYRQVEEMLAARAAAAPGAGAEAGEIVVTDVEFGDERPDHSIPIKLHYAILPREHVATALGRAEAATGAAATAVPTWDVQPATTLGRSERAAGAAAPVQDERTRMTSGAYRGRLRDPSTSIVQFDPLGGLGRLYAGSFSHQFVDAEGRRKGAVHGAQDIVMPGGTPVYAPVTGRISPDTGPGRMSIYDPNSGMTHVLAHIVRDERIPKGRGYNWREWPAIEAGTRVGVLSPRASSPSVVQKGTKIESGAHLHYRIYDPSTYQQRPISEETGAENRWGAVDPYPYLTALRKGRRPG